MVCAVERGERIHVEFEWRIRRGARYDRAIRRYGPKQGDEWVARIKETQENRLRWSSGRAFAPPGGTPRIIVSAGTDETDARMVLLHELAHIVAGPRVHHGSRWRRVVTRMYARYGGPEIVAHAAKHERRKRLFDTLTM